MIEFLFDLGLRWDGLIAGIVLVFGLGISIFNLWNNDRKP
jgi:hypothetical protein